MELTGQVIEVASGAQFTDSVQRVVIKVDGANVWAQKLSVPNSNHEFALDDIVVVQLSTRRTRGKAA